MADKSVNVTIGATLSGSFKGAFKDAANSVRSFDSAVKKLGSSGSGGIGNIARQAGQVGTAMSTAAGGAMRLGNALGKFNGAGAGMVALSRGAQLVAQNTNQAVAAMSRLQSMASAAGRAMSTMGRVGVGAAGAAYSLDRAFRPSRDQDEAKTRLRMSYMERTGLIDKGYEETTRQAIKLGETLPGTTKDFMDLAIALKQAGTPVSAINGGVLEAAANMKTLFQLPSEEAGKFANNLTEALGIADSDMVEGVNQLWKTKQATGVDPMELKYAVSRSGARFGTQGVTGLSGAKEQLALAGMLSRKGVNGTMAGTEMAQWMTELPGFNRKLANGKGDDMKKARADLKAAGIKMDFTDKKTGKFLGMDNAYQQMEKLQKLNPEQLSNVIKAMWGEQGGLLAQFLVKEGKAGMDKIKAEIDNQASDTQAITELKQSTNAKKEQAEGAAENAIAAIGNTLKTQLDKVYEGAADFFNKVRDLATEFPNITAALATVTAGALAAGSAMATIGTFNLAKNFLTNGGAAAAGAGAGAAAAAGAAPAGQVASKLPWFARMGGAVGTAAKFAGPAGLAYTVGDSINRLANGEGKVDPADSGDRQKAIDDIGASMRRQAGVAATAGTQTGSNFSQNLGAALDAAVSKAEEVANKIKSILNFSVSPQVNINTTGGAALSGAATSTATAPGKQSSVKSSTVNVYAAAGQSEERIGRMAAAHVDRQNRNTAADLRSGTFDWVG